MRRALQRYDVTPVLRNHYLALGRETPGRSRWSAWLVQLAVPAGLGVAIGLAGMQFTSLTPFLTASSLFIGVMLSLFVFLVNLRIKVSETAKLVYQKKLHRLIGASAVTCLYLALVAVLATILLTALASVELPFWNGLQLRRVGSALAVAVLAHLVINLLTMVRRAFAMYYDLFAADLGPELKSLPTVAPPPARSDKTG